MKTFLIIQILCLFSFNLYSRSREKKVKPDELTYINIEPSIFYSSIKIFDIYNNANGNIVSAYNYGLNISWNSAISYNFHYKIILDFKTYNFKENIDKKTYNENKFNTYAIGLGLKQIFSKNFVLDLDFLFSDIFYIRFLNEDSIVTDKTYAYNLSLNIYYALLNYQKFIIASEINPILIYPNKVGSLYKTELSYGARLGVSLKYSIIKFLIAYRTIYKNTEVLNQEQRDLIFTGRLAWEL